MGRLSPLRVDLLGLSILLVIFTTQTSSAPVEESSPDSRFSNEKGCYYMNKLYPSGSKIDTNQSCTNCTCIGNTLMCYLRVCPFVKPMGEHCISEQHEGECCPKFWCPEVYPRPVTETPESEERGCYLEGKYYDEGDRIPMDPLKPCEVCYCIRNTSVCTVQKCELEVDGCFPQYKIGSCCPSRYNCTEEAATTIPPGILEPEEYKGCKKDGVMYKDGEKVPSKDHCQTCYCMKHEVVCAVEKCEPPAENCVGHDVEEGKCCPTNYECPPTTEVPVWFSTLPPPLSNATTAFPPGVTDGLLTTLDDTIRQTFTEQERESLPTKMFVDGKGTITPFVSTEVPTDLATDEVSLATAGDLSPRPREPKITEVPDDMFTPSLPKATGRPVFYPSRPIPGEGICRHENKTYQNKQIVPSADPCRLNCTCVNSVVLCERVECILSPPESGTNCKIVKLLEECCPKYICDTPSDLPGEKTVPSEVVTEQEQLAQSSTTLAPLETSAIEVSTEEVQKEITVEPVSFTTVTRETSESAEQTKETAEESETTLSSVSSTPAPSKGVEEVTTSGLDTSHEVSHEPTSLVTESTHKELVTGEVVTLDTMEDEERVKSTTVLPGITSEPETSSVDEVSSIKPESEKESILPGIDPRTRPTTPEPPTEGKVSSEAPVTITTSEEKESSSVESVTEKESLVTGIDSGTKSTTVELSTGGEVSSEAPVTTTVSGVKESSSLESVTEKESLVTELDAGTKSTTVELSTEGEMSSETSKTPVTSKETESPSVESVTEKESFVTEIDAGTKSTTVKPSIEGETSPGIPMTTSAEKDVEMETESEPEHLVTVVETTTHSQPEDEKTSQPPAPVTKEQPAEEKHTTVELTTESSVEDLTKSGLTTKLDLTSIKEEAITTEAKVESTPKPHLVDTTVPFDSTTLEAKTVSTESSQFSPVSSKATTAAVKDDVVVHTQEITTPSTSLKPLGVQTTGTSISITDTEDESTASSSIAVDTEPAAETPKIHLTTESHDETSPKEATTEAKTESTAKPGLAETTSETAKETEDIQDITTGTPFKIETTPAAEFTQSPKIEIHDLVSEKEQAVTELESESTSKLIPTEESSSEEPTKFFETTTHKESTTEGGIGVMVKETTKTETPVVTPESIIPSTTGKPTTEASLPTETEEHFVTDKAPSTTFKDTATPLESTTTSPIELKTTMSEETSESFETSQAQGVTSLKDELSTKLKTETTPSPVTKADTVEIVEEELVTKGHDATTSEGVTISTKESILDIETTKSPVTIEIHDTTSKQGSTTESTDVSGTIEHVSTKTTGPSMAEEVESTKFLASTASVKPVTESEESTKSTAVEIETTAATETPKSHIPTEVHDVTSQKITEGITESVTAEHVPTATSASDGVATSEKIDTTTPKHQTAAITTVVPQEGETTTLAVKTTEGAGVTQGLDVTGSKEPITEVATETSSLSSATTKSTASESVEGGLVTKGVPEMPMSEVTSSTPLRIDTTIAAEFTEPSATSIHEITEEKFSTEFEGEGTSLKPTTVTESTLSETAGDKKVTTEIQDTTREEEVSIAVQKDMSPMKPFTVAVETTEEQKTAPDVLISTSEPEKADTSVKSHESEATAVTETTTAKSSTPEVIKTEPSKPTSEQVTEKADELTTHKPLTTEPTTLKVTDGIESLSTEQHGGTSTVTESSTETETFSDYITTRLPFITTFADIASAVATLTSSWTSESSKTSETLPEISESTREDEKLSVSPVADKTSSHVTELTTKEMETELTTQPTTPEHVVVTTERATVPSDKHNFTILPQVLETTTQPSTVEPSDEVLLEKEKSVTATPETLSSQEISTELHPDLSTLSEIGSTAKDIHTQSPEVSELPKATTVSGLIRAKTPGDSDVTESSEPSTVSFETKLPTGKPTTEKPEEVTFTPGAVTTPTVSQPISEITEKTHKETTLGEPEESSEEDKVTRVVSTISIEKVEPVETTSEKDGLITTGTSQRTTLQDQEIETTTHFTTLEESTQSKTTPHHDVSGLTTEGTEVSTSEIAKAEGVSTLKEKVKSTVKPFELTSEEISSKLATLDGLTTDSSEVTEFTTHTITQVASETTTPVTEESVSSETEAEAESEKTVSLSKVTTLGLEDESVEASSTDSPSTSDKATPSPFKPFDDASTSDTTTEVVPKSTSSAESTLPTKSPVTTSKAVSEITPEIITSVSDSVTTVETHRPSESSTIAESVTKVSTEMTTIRSEESITSDTATTTAESHEAETTKSESVSKLTTLGSEDASSELPSSESTSGFPTTISTEREKTDIVTFKPFSDESASVASTEAESKDTSQAVTEDTLLTTPKTESDIEAKTATSAADTELPSDDVVTTHAAREATKIADETSTPFLERTTTVLQDEGTKVTPTESSVTSEKLTTVMMEATKKPLPTVVTDVPTETEVTEIKTETEEEAVKTPVTSVHELSTTQLIEETTEKDSHAPKTTVPPSIMAKTPSSERDDVPITSVTEPESSKLDVEQELTSSSELKTTVSKETTGVTESPTIHPSTESATSAFETTEMKLTTIPDSKEAEEGKLTTPTASASSTTVEQTQKDVTADLGVKIVTETSHMETESTERPQTISPTSEVSDEMKDVKTSTQEPIISEVSLDVTTIEPGVKTTLSSTEKEISDITKQETESPPDDVTVQTISDFTTETPEAETTHIIPETVKPQRFTEEPQVPEIISTEHETTVKSTTDFVSKVPTESVKELEVTHSIALDEDKTTKVVPTTAQFTKPTMGEDKEETAITGVTTAASTKVKPESDVPKLTTEIKDETAATERATTGFTEISSKSTVSETTEESKESLSARVTTLAPAEISPKTAETTKEDEESMSTDGVTTKRTETTPEITTHKVHTESHLTTASEDLETTKQETTELDGFTTKLPITSHLSTESSVLTTFGEVAAPVTTGQPIIKAEEAETSSVASTLSSETTPESSTELKEKEITIKSTSVSEISTPPVPTVFSEETETGKTPSEDTTPLMTDEGVGEFSKTIVSDSKSPETTEPSKITTESKEFEVISTTVRTEEKEIETASTATKTSHDGETTEITVEVDKATSGVTVSTESPFTIAPVTASVHTSEKSTEDEYFKITTAVTKVPELETSPKISIETEFAVPNETLAEGMTTEPVEEMEETEPAVTETQVTKKQSTPTAAGEEQTTSKVTIVPSTKDLELTSPTISSHAMTTEAELGPTTHKVRGQEVTTIAFDQKTETAKPVEIPTVKEKSVTAAVTGAPVTEAELLKTSTEEGEKISSLLPKVAPTEKMPETVPTTEEPKTTESEVTVVSEEVLVSNHTFGVDSMVKESSTTPATTFVTELEGEVFKDTTLSESTTLKPPVTSVFTTESPVKDTESTVPSKPETTQLVPKDHPVVLSTGSTALQSDFTTEEGPVVKVSTRIPETAETEAEQEISTRVVITSKSTETSASEITTGKEIIATSTPSITTGKVSEETELMTTSESETSTSTFKTSVTASEIPLKTDDKTTIREITTEATDSVPPSDISTAKTTEHVDIDKVSTLPDEFATSKLPEVTGMDGFKTTGSTFVSETVGSEAMETTLFGKTVEADETTHVEIVTEQDKATHPTEKTTMKSTVLPSEIPEQTTISVSTEKELETRKEHETTTSVVFASTDKLLIPMRTTSTPLEAETSTIAEDSSAKPETTKTSIPAETDASTDIFFKPHTTEEVTVKPTEFAQKTTPSEKDVEDQTVTESSEERETTEPTSTSEDKLLPKTTILHISTESKTGEETRSDESTTRGGTKESAITSEPVSPVTESTSSTATTTTVSVTEVVTRAFTAADSTREQESEETTVTPLSTSTFPGDVEPNINVCVINGTLYKEGDSIDGGSPCEKCHCVQGSISCFKIICKVPKQGCFPDEHRANECCPSSYRCPSDKNETEFTSTVVQDVTQKDLTTPIPISFMFSTFPTSISSTVLVTKAPSDEPSTFRVDLDTTEKEEITREKTTLDVTDFESKTEISTQASSIPSAVASDVTKEVSVDTEKPVTEQELQTTLSTERTPASSIPSAVASDVTEEVSVDTEKPVTEQELQTTLSTERTPASSIPSAVASDVTKEVSVDTEKPVTEPELQTTLSTERTPASSIPSAVASDVTEEVSVDTEKPVTELELQTTVHATLSTERTPASSIPSAVASDVTKEVSVDTEKPVTEQELQTTLSTERTTASSIPSAVASDVTKEVSVDTEKPVTEQELQTTVHATLSTGRTTASSIPSAVASDVTKEVSVDTEKPVTEQELQTTVHATLSTERTTASSIPSAVASDVTKEVSVDTEKPVTEQELQTTVHATLSTERTMESSEVSTEMPLKVTSTEKTEHFDLKTTEPTLTTILGQEKTTLPEFEQRTTLVTSSIATSTAGTSEGTAGGATASEGIKRTMDDDQRWVEEPVPVVDDTTSDISDNQRHVVEPDRRPTPDDDSEETSKPAITTTQTVALGESREPVTELETSVTTAADEVEIETTVVSVEKTKTTDHSTEDAGLSTSTSPSLDVVKLTTETETSASTLSDGIKSKSSIEGKETTIPAETPSFALTDSTEVPTEEPVSDIELDQVLTTVMPVKLPKADDVTMTTLTLTELTTEKPEGLPSQTETKETEITSTGDSSTGFMVEHFTTSTVSSASKTDGETSAEATKATTASEVVTSDVTEETTTHSKPLSTESEAETTVFEDKTSIKTQRTEIPLQESTEKTLPSLSTGTEKLFADDVTDGQVSSRKTTQPEISTVMSTVSLKSGDLTSTESHKTSTPTTKQYLTTAIPEADIESKVETTSRTTASKTEEDVLELKTTPQISTFSETTTHKETAAPELVTEKIDTKATLVSLSKEGTTVIPAVTTGLDSEEKPVSDETATEKQITSTAAEAITKYEEPRTTDKVFQFVSSRFTTLPPSSLSTEISSEDGILSTKSVKEEEVETTSASVTQESSEEITELIEDIELTTKSTISPLVTINREDELLTTKKPSIKSLDDVETSETPMVEKVTSVETQPEETSEPSATSVATERGTEEGVGIAGKETSETTVTEGTSTMVTERATEQGVAIASKETSEPSVTEGTSTMATEIGTEQGVAISPKKTSETTVTEGTSTMATERATEQGVAIASKETSEPSVTEGTSTMATERAMEQGVAIASKETSEPSVTEGTSTMATEIGTEQGVAISPKETSETTVTEGTSTMATEIGTEQGVAISPKKTSETTVTEGTSTMATEIGTEQGVAISPKETSETTVTEGTSTMATEIGTEQGVAISPKETSETTVTEGTSTMATEIGTEQGVSISPKKTSETTVTEGTSTMATEIGTEQGVAISPKKTSETKVTEGTSTMATTEKARAVTKDELPESTVSKLMTSSHTVDFTTTEGVIDKETEETTLAPKTATTIEVKSNETFEEDLKSTSSKTTGIIRDDTVKFTEITETEVQETESAVTLEPHSVITTARDFAQTREEKPVSETSTPETNVSELEKRVTTQKPDILKDNVTSIEETESPPTSTLSALVTAFKERVRTTISPLFHFSTEKPLTDSAAFITEKPSFGEGFTVMTDKEEGNETEATLLEGDLNVTKSSSTQQETEISTFKSIDISEVSTTSTTELPALKTGELFPTSESEKPTPTELVADLLTTTSVELLPKKITEKTTEAEFNGTTEGVTAAGPKVTEPTSEPGLSTVTGRVADDEILPKSSSKEEGTTRVSEAETTTTEEHRRPTVTEVTTPKPTEVVTKAYKAIETTPMPTEAENATALDDSDFIEDFDEGACIFEGRVYASAEQIPRADACEFCFCFRGDIICLQQSCPPPALNCHKTMIAGYCCPRYDCPVLVTSRNISSFAKRKGGVQPIIIQKRIEKRAIRAQVEVKGCQINGTFYQVGQTVARASGPCLHCLCEDGGNMRCDPQKCKPQPPLMLKMNNSYFKRR